LESRPLLICLYFQFRTEFSFLPLLIEAKRAFLEPLFDFFSTRKEVLDGGACTLLSEGFISGGGGNIAVREEGGGGGIALPITGGGGIPLRITGGGGIPPTTLGGGGFVLLKTEGGGTPITGGGGRGNPSWFIVNGGGGGI